MTMDYFETVRQRRSVREFKPGTISDSELELILDAGRRAPSGWNLQPRAFIAVTDPDLLRRALELLKADRNCCALIAVLMLQKETPSGAYWVEDACAAAENMLLAVTALGYGACWVQGGLQRCLPEVRELLGVPDEVLLLAVLPLGVPKGNGSQAAKKPLTEIAYRDRYGQAWET